MTPSLSQPREESPSTSSSVTLDHNLLSSSKDDIKSSQRSSSPSIVSPHHETHHHFSPPVPVQEIREGPTTITIGPPAPFGEEGMIPDEDNEDESSEKRNRIGEAGGPSSDKEGKDIETGQAKVVEREKDIFDRFSPAKKRIIVVIVSYSALIGPIASSIFLPSIPQMAKELNTNASIINYTVAVYIVVFGTSPLIWSPLSGFYGRRFVYICAFPICAVASIGVALSPSVGAVIGTRVLQALSASSAMAVGAGGIGDIYRPTERGNAMGWFYSMVLIGPALSPVIGGVFSQYTKATWRASQYFLAGMSAVAFALALFVLPETTHPPIPHDVLKEKRGKKFVIYRFSPLTSLGLFRWPNVCLISIVSSCVLLSLYVMLVPLSYIFATRYNITNVALAGCIYLPNGAGNIIGARIAGPYADKVVKKGIRQRGYRRPEDRLFASLPGAFIGIPASLIAFGWLVETGAGGMGPALVFSVFIAAFLMTVLAPQNTYLIDSMPTRSAEVIAVNNFLRYLFSAAATAYVLPMVDAIGWGWTMTIAALMVFLSAFALYATMRWGEKWRMKANAKYHYEGTPPDCVPPEPVKNTPNAAISPIESKHGGSDSDDDQKYHDGDDVGHLPPPRTKTPKGRPGSSAGKSVGNSAANPAGGSGLQRLPTRDSDMPRVEEVLKRTVSLSGASTHGG